MDDKELSETLATCEEKRRRCIAQAGQNPFKKALCITEYLRCVIEASGRELAALDEAFVKEPAEGDEGKSKSE